MRLRVFVAGLLLAAYLPAQDMDEPSAWELYEKGRDAEKAGHFAQAYLLYAEAAAKDPKNRTYWAREQSIQSRAAMQSKPLPTVGDLDKELAEPPEDLYFDQPTAAELSEAENFRPPVRLDADKAPHDLDFNGDFKKLFQEVAHVYGLDVIFDSDYQPGTATRFRLKDVDYRNALHGLELATGSFIVPVTSKIMLVAKDTAQKRTEIEPTATVSVRLPEAYTAQEFQEMVRDVQQTMGIEKVGLDPTTNTVVLRDRISKIVYAQALFDQLLHARAQVGIEVRFVEITRDDSITYGINLPAVFSLNALTTALNNTVSLSSGVTGLLTFGGGDTLIGLSVLSSAVVAQLSKSDSKLMLRSYMRSMSGQKATLHIGEKYPIMTGGYGTSTAALGAGSVTPAPTFSFQDLGLTLTVTPLVHGTEDVSLDLDAQYQVLTGQSINGLPVISNRAIKDVTRLRMGEWALVAGLLTTNEARTLSGIAGLNHIPFLGPLLNNHSTDKSNDQILLLLRPVLLSLPPDGASSRSLYTGTETRPLTPF